MVQLSIGRVSVKNHSPKKGGSLPMQEVLQQPPQWSDCPYSLYFDIPIEFSFLSLKIVLILEMILSDIKKKKPQIQKFIFWLIPGACPALIPALCVTHFFFWGGGEQCAKPPLVFGAPKRLVGIVLTVKESATCTWHEGGASFLPK